MLRILSDRRAAGVLACVGLLLIGWSGLLVPSLIRVIEREFVQTDAGLGVFYFINAVSYASGSFGGGMLTERFGRRRVLSLATALLGVGLATIGIVPLWAVVLLAAVPAGIGAGVIDGGVNGLVLYDRQVGEISLQQIDQFGNVRPVRSYPNQRKTWSAFLPIGSLVMSQRSASSGMTARRPAACLAA